MLFPKVMKPRKTFYPAKAYTNILMLIFMKVLGLLVKILMKRSMVNVQSRLKPI